MINIGYATVWFIIGIAFAIYTIKETRKEQKDRFSIIFHAVVSICCFALSVMYIVDLLAI